MDISIVIYGAIALIVAFTVIKVAWFTVKKVITNVILGYVAYLIATMVFHIDMIMNLALWSLTALLGPIPVIVAAFFHW